MMMAPELGAESLELFHLTRLTANEQVPGKLQISYLRIHVCFYLEVKMSEEDREWEETECCL